MSTVQKRLPIFYVALGDSLTVGIGAFILPGFVKAYQRLASKALQSDIDVFNFGRHGATTNDLLEKVKLPVVRLAIQHAQLFTISIGGNDLRRVAPKYFWNKDGQLIRRTILQAHQNIGKVLAEIKSLKEGETDYLIRLLNLYNPYPGVADAAYWITKFNQGLLRFEEQQVKVVDIYRPFKGMEKTYISLDGLHPNGKGHSLIAKQLNESGYAPLLTLS